MNRLLKSFFGLTLGVAFSLGVAASLNANKKAVTNTAEAATPSSYSKIYRFTAPAEYWGNTVYVHAWGSKTSSNDMEWPGINLSNEYSYNESSRKVYTFATNVSDYTYLIFHNNNGWKTDNITIGNNTAWYLDSGNTPGTWTPTNQTYYLYDYRNLFGGAAKCYAWQSGGSLNNGDYPGVAMTSVQYGSGQLYSITLDPAFDKFKLGIGDSSNTGDLWINQKRGQCYCFWESNPGFSEDLNWVKAHDWANNTMHIRDITTSTGGDTGACRGDSGYYQKAKTAYNSFSDDIKAQFQYVDEYEDAQTRFSAWAKANGETASFSGTTLTISSARSFVPFSLSGDNNTIIVLAAICSLGILSVGVYYFFKKSKKAEE